MQTWNSQRFINMLLSTAVPSYKKMENIESEATVNGQAFQFRRTPEYVKDLYAAFAAAYSEAGFPRDERMASVHSQFDS
jgi:hypothetical protein